MDYWDPKQDEITQVSFKSDVDVCQCGAWKVYGKSISDMAHADYCPRKKIHDNLSTRPNYSQY